MPAKRDPGSAPEAYLRTLVGDGIPDDLPVVLAARRRWRSPANARTDSRDPEELDARRTRANEIFERLRETFWDADPSEVDATLAALDLDDLPDLERYRRRLVRLGDLRDEMDAIAAEPKVRGTLVTALRDILVAPARPAVGMRESYARKVRTREQANSVRNSAKAIRRVAPEIASIEADWLERLSNVLKRRRDSRATAGLGCFTIWILFQLIRRLAEYLSDTL